MLAHFPAAPKGLPQAKRPECNGANSQVGQRDWGSETVLIKGQHLPSSHAAKSTTPLAQRPLPRNCRYTCPAIETALLAIQLLLCPRPSRHSLSTRVEYYTVITRITAGALTLRGVSLGGVYTSIFCPELNAVFDVGIAPRSSSAADFIFLSHGHVDHVGALSSLLGIRALVGKKKPPKVFLPQEIEAPILRALEAMTELQRYDLAVDTVAMKAGDLAPMRGDLQVRAFLTHHVVPSLGFSLVRHIKKLKEEFRGLPGQEIAELKRAGKDLFNVVERTELSYCTDTLIQALDNNPELYRSRVLVLECTFLDERKPIKLARAGCHIHLDEIIERAERFENESLVLMHFSQLYKPAEVVEILDRRCPPALRARIVPFVPKSKHWPG